MTKRYALALASVLILALPSAAQAATKTVYMGAPPKDQKKFNSPYGTDVVDFFPRNTTIAPGDSVKFDLVAFHNVDFPPKGGKMQPARQDVDWIRMYPIAATQYR